jgi:hypothetical protein
LRTPSEDVPEGGTETRRRQRGPVNVPRCPV